ncbi:hypothetical protein HDU97_006143 [Phlyctochytrium planicorne]|nr:hypothetical protein HDU97_006143 [Phlyctochytrium planicorne]
MCNPKCSGQLLCDSSVANSCGQSIDFEEMGTMVAKGIEGAIHLYSPKDIKFGGRQEEKPPEELILEGREIEMSVLHESVERWKKSERSLALIVGKSGFGKTQLARYFLSSLEKLSPNISTPALITWTDFKGTRRSRGTLIRNETRDSSLLGDHSSSMSSSIINTDSPKVEFLLNLGMSRESIKKLQANYPDLFEDFKGGAADGNETKDLSDSNDCTSILKTVIMIILSDLLPTLNQRVIIFLDDAQWMDSGSFETTLEVIQSCPFVYVLFTSRPKEEYASTLRHYYEKFVSNPFCKCIMIERLSNHSIERLVKIEMKSHNIAIDSVSRSLMDEIIGKSQGKKLGPLLTLTFQLSGNPMIPFHQ